MPIYSTEDYGGKRVLSEYSTSTPEVLTTAVEDAFSDNIATKLWQYGMGRERNSGGVIAKAEVERQAKQAGVTLEHIPEEGMSSAVVEDLIERQYQKKRRREAMDAAGGGFKNGAAEFAGGLVGSLMDPIQLAGNFIPVVGQERYAAMLAKATGRLGRAGVRASVGAAEGAVGAALLEPANYGLSQQLHDDYTAANSLMNIGFGTAMGSGLHMGIGAISDALGRGIPREAAPPVGRNAETISNLPPEARHDMGRTAIAQAAEDRNINVDLPAKSHLVPEREALAREIDPDAFPAPDMKQAEWRRLEREQHKARLDKVESKLSELTQRHADHNAKINAAKAELDAIRAEQPASLERRSAIVEREAQLKQELKALEEAKKADVELKQIKELQDESAFIAKTMEEAEGGPAALQRRQAEAFALADEKIKQKLRNEQATPEQREAKARELDPEAHERLEKFDEEYKAAEAELANLYKELESIPESTRQVADAEQLMDQIDDATQKFKGLDQQRAELQRRVAESRRKADLQFEGKAYQPTTEDIRAVQNDQPNSKFIEPEVEQQQRTDLEQAELDDLSPEHLEKEAAEVLESLKQTAEQAGIEPSRLLEYIDQIKKDADEYETAISAMGNCALRKG